MSESWEPESGPWKPDDGDKVSFRLFKDSEGYPPADWEHLWAERLPNGLFRLDNIPFFAKGVAIGDVVAVDEVDDMIVFRAVVTPSGHSTIRVVFFDLGELNVLRQRLELVGCSSELSHVPNLIAVDIPPVVPVSTVRGILREGEVAKKWEYEESALGQP